jgi:chromosomal replication initiator protein
VGHPVWEEFLTIIKQEAGSRVVETWFKAVTLSHWDSREQKVYLQAPNTFVKEWLQDNYYDLIHCNLKRLFNVQDLCVVLETEKTTSVVLRSPEMPSTKKSSKFVGAKRDFIVPQVRSRDHVNDAYTFDNFVVGPSNSFAEAAAKAITETAGTLYNPLFLYGDSGLGKTHLLHAIGNEVKRKYTNVEILYQTADRFVSEFINAIRFDKIDSFKAKYKTVDVLLVDDIQFFSNKEQTQEAFFHIFNSLYDARKQLVFSSDSMPQAISGLAERLRSRLAWGLVADLRTPTIETKIAILKHKAEANNEVLSDDVAHFMASRSIHSIRELEGSLIRVMAFASLVQQPLSVELSQRVLEQVHTKSQAIDISFDSIVTALKRHYTYTLTDLTSKNRNKDVSFVRQVAMFLMKDLTEKSLREIGNYLGGRDHSTVLHAIEKIKTQLQVDKFLETKVENIKQEIRLGR